MMKSNVMIVDDNLDNLRVLENILSAEGHEVLAAIGGAVALQAAARHHPDLILLDIMMPEMDGYEVCRRLKADPATADIPILFLSALTEIEEKIQAFEAGAVDYITKPFAEKEVMARVRTHLRLRRMELKLQEEVNQAVKDKTKAYEELKRSEELFRVIFERSTLGVTLTAPSGQLLKVNQAFADMLGYQIDEIQRRNFVDITHADDIAKSYECIRCLLGNEQSTYRMEKRYYHKNGQVVWVDLSTTLLRDDDGAPLYFLTSMADITERKRVEEDREKLQAQLLQSQKMESVGVLAGGVAHDFNNILQAISGYTSLILLDKQPEDPEYPGLTAIEMAVHRATQLVKQLLLFSRKATTQSTTIDLNQEVENARRILVRTIPKMIDIEVITTGRLWPITADPVQMEQILLNLGTNAVDAMPDGGKLIIETENITLDEEFTNTRFEVRPGRYVLMKVSDTGHGIDKEAVEHIFEPFFTTKEIGKGTGLGLASVYGIVKSHGGYINCYSEVGQGTTFKIYLPAAKSSDTEPPQNGVMETPRGGNETILLVDDEEQIRDFAKQALMKFGYQVLTAASGEQALEIYSNNRSNIQLIIMDIGMPGMGGHKCLIELIRMDPSVKVLVASGYSINGQLKITLEAGAAGYVGKPYQLADLLNKVRAVLDKAE